MKKSISQRARFAFSSGIAGALAFAGASVAPVLLSACTQSVGADQTKTAMTFTEKNNGQTVQAHVGDRFEVRLESNASTGYEWLVQTQDAKALESDGEPRRIPPTSNQPGAPGQQVFAFKVKRAGETKLKLIYARPWEKDKPADKFVLTVSATTVKK